MGIRQAWLNCKSSHRTPHIIWLPQPIPSRVDARSAEWRDVDWKISLLCMDCACAYDYSAKDIHARDSAEESQIVASCIQRQCGSLGCNKRIKVFTAALESLSPQEMRKDPREWDSRCMCAGGHLPAKKFPSDAKFDVEIKRAPFPWGALGLQV
jgi:hypothetical protein